ncbi:hypothetical protein G7Y89_g6640 [Cudoniella acicularis]|uniref:S-adenosyl-L-methionine-dependent methyltransferase n=1 Tax=Cudoniella acicularis TaxID=354080 RepID=A0A8H4RK14_9HELO|nr:hypothetical protein G7Y89_g6640 [Cudoniella acicularis]
MSQYAEKQRLGKSLFTPLPEHLDSILDIGCGTGVWALAVAAERPSTQVIATDLTLPKTLPPSNVKFLQSDAEQPWPFDQKFGFIHCRMLFSGIHDWPSFLARCREHLAPGGWIELHGPYQPYRADNPAANKAEASSLIKWGYACQESWERSGIDCHTVNHQMDRLRAAGFENIEERRVTWPIGEWGDTERERQIGAITLENLSGFIGLVGVQLMANHSTLTLAQKEELVSGVQKDLSENIHENRYYVALSVFTAQKPLDN